jgi:predicted ester cyclase
VSVDDLVGEGNKVVARLTWRGTVSQEVYGVPPNGQTIEWTGVAINRFEDGKLVERWFNSDELGMMRGMGLLPPMGDDAAPADAGDTQPQAEAAPQSGMSVASPTGSQVTDDQLERNKEIVRTFYEDIFNTGDVSHLEEVMVEDFIDHGEALFGSPHGRNILEQGIAAIHGMFPSMSVQIDDMIAEGDMVGVRGTMSMKLTHDWLGKPATGQELTWKGLSLFRIEDGKIVERFFNSDSLYILDQLGYWPVEE